MTSQVIPDAAVEAAAIAHHAILAKMGHCSWDELLDVGKASKLYLMRAALEAAAPHMLEGAYTDGYCDGMSGEQHNLAKYRPAP